MRFPRLRTHSTAWAVAPLCVLAFLGPARAQNNYVWNNTTANWGVGANWTPTGPPPSAATTTLTFGGTGGTAYTSTNDVANPFVLNGITFNSAATVTNIIAGSALNFSANGGTNPTVTQAGAGAFTIRNALTLTNDRTFAGTGAGTLNVGDATTAGVVSGTGRVIVSRQAVAGVNRTLAMFGANTYSGGTQLDAGELVVFTATSLGTGTVTIGGSADARILRASTAATATLTLANAFAVGGDFTINQGGTQDLNLSGAVDLLGGVRTITVGSRNTTWTGIVSNGGITKLGTSSLILNAANTFNGGLNVNAGTVRGQATRSLGAVTNLVTLATGTTLELRNDVATAYGNPLTLTGAGAAATVSVDRVGANTATRSRSARSRSPAARR